jgi:urease accessory protein
VQLGPGEGSVTVAARGAGSVLTSRAARAPLVLLQPRNRGRAAWLFVGTLGGGLVDGDEVRLRARVEAGAALYLGTQASTKIYAARPSGVGAAQSLAIDVADGALLASIPDPVACFARSRYRQETHVRLAGSGAAIVVDAVTCGRRAHGERWDLARLDLLTTVERDGVELVRDRLLLDPAHGDLRERLGRADALATLIAVGEATTGLRDHLAAAPHLARKAPVLVAVSRPRPDVVVARVATGSVEQLVHALRSLLAPVPALLGDDPFAQRA